MPTRMVGGDDLVDAADGRTFDVVEPHAGETIAQVPEGSAEDVDRAVAAASRAFEGGWATMAPRALPGLAPRALSAPTSARWDGWGAPRTICYRGSRLVSQSVRRPIRTLGRRSPMTLSPVNQTLRAPSPEGALGHMAVPGWGYLREGPFGGRSDKWMARLDALARPCAFLFGVAYLGLSVWFALDINRLASFWMFFRRSIEIDSLVSPLLPLVISGLGYTAWCTWHVGRVRLLGQHTVFETVCEAELRNRPTPNSVLRSSLRDDLKRCARDLRTIRGRLFRVIPATGALALLGTFGCLALWIQPQFGRSLE